ncbi:MAG: hypothetical protein V4722_04425 [Bacteroidota bacterium]
MTVALNIPLTLYKVPIITGAPEMLVCRRELRNKYYTNRDIKTWAAYFLLKSLTTSSIIKQWDQQSSFLEGVLQCNERTLRARLAEMVHIGLCQLCTATKNLTLTSYEKAAEILDIKYEGTTTILYDTATQRGCQVFQYLIRVDEIQNAKLKQLKALNYHITKNPLLKESLMQEMERFFNDDRQKLENGVFFQKRLYELQSISFKEGSAIYEIIHHRRADINRGVKGIQNDHAYKGLSSVSYMKKVLVKYNLVTVKHNVVESRERNRVSFLTCDRKTNEKQSKWNKHNKSTLMVFCDDITPVAINSATPGAAAGNIAQNRKSNGGGKDENRKAA